MIINQTILKQFLRFAVVGVIATAIHYGIYWLLLMILSPTIAYSIGYFVSLVFNFLLSNYFTFKTNPSTKKGVGFVVAHCINYLLHIGLLNLFIYIGLSEKIAPFPVFMIAFPINFILVRTALKSKKL